MSFLQPGLLLALPIVLLPIVIHLINQRRFQTVHWAAMQFLLTANQLSQGYARIRRWLILAARMVAIGALIFAISRPLSSGILGLVGAGRIDTAIVVVDRSPSMTARGAGNATKLTTALQTIASSLETLHPSRIVVIDSVDGRPVEVDEASQILQLPSMKPQAGSANIPAMIEAAYDYIDTERPSQCDIWIASDMRRNDWDAKNGRWNAVRQSLQRLPQSVRVRLLSNVATPTDNRSIRVSRAQPIQQNDETQLALSFSLRHDADERDSQSIPLQLVLNGARSEILARFDDNSSTGRQEQVIPIDQSQGLGWGSLSLSPDTMAGDNRFYFVYEPPVDRRTLIVSEAIEMVQPWLFAASESPESSIVCRCDTIQPSQWIGADLGEVALVIWHSPIPSADHPDHRLLESYVDRGGQLLFLPAESPSKAAFHGVRWGDWQAHDETYVSQWIMDRGLLGRTEAGEPLPVDQLKIFQTCGVTGAMTSIARLGDNSPLLARVPELPNVYFFATSAAPNASSLADDGVVLYAIVHRLLASGVASLGQTRMRVAGESELGNDVNWKQIAGDSTALSTEYPNQAGVYQFGDRLIAVNRSHAEDALATVDAAEIDDLFAGLDFDRLEVESDDGRSIVQEIWRLALMMMLAALIVESVLSIPRRPRRPGLNPMGVSAA